MSLRRILFTFGTRLGAALLNFGLVWLTARWLGAEGRGQVSLFTIDRTLLLLFAGLVGGSSLIYLAPRRNLWHLLLPAYAWSALIGLLGTAAVWWWRRPSPGYSAYLLVATLVEGFVLVHLQLLLGRRQERLYNLVILLQSAGIALGLTAAFFMLQWRSATAYYAAHVLTYAAIWALTARMLQQQPDRPAGHGKRWRFVARELARHSRGAHFSNIVGFANYRLGFYFVAAWVGTGAVGVLSVGVALAEAVWLIPRSISQVQYVDTVYRTNHAAPVQATVRAVRLAVVLSALAVLALALVPAQWLAAVFGRDFAGAQRVIWALALGVVAFSMHMQLSAFFAGTAQYRTNNLAAVLGLGLTLVSCFAFVPQYGAAGAAWAATVSYLGSTVWLAWQFVRAAGIGPAELLPRPADVALLLQRVRH
ncbi:lipopolysaccharide biosynthesis protein [Hymenobacter latericus]|uniref:lipopolysaccharide biosynthesis protein n=1 Tax=Hymenobacter sp. YIM 151858-1 TaxID=2987688 RepID=UPI002226832A|nr:polysaccharide biosynthesis C-terminal domain-containing protein [Hymenobacter sp. YIM 151858-1]UYZ57817.1 polysaccharide biosynthesis C-terminal domain-containing protein [Hymenobacter sp. YIM 151858-1]